MAKSQKPKTSISKKNQPLESKRRFKLRYILLSIPLLIILGVAAERIYNSYSLKQEAKAFATLKQDLITLQGEFNKIDRGWKYSEGCNGKGHPFEHDQASTCSMSLTLDPSPEINLAHYSAAVANSKEFAFIDPAKEFTDSGITYVNNRVEYTPEADVRCNLTQVIKETHKSAVLSCSKTAGKFYFKRVDR